MAPRTRILCHKDPGRVSLSSGRSRGYWNMRQGDVGFLFFLILFCLFVFIYLFIYLWAFFCNKSETLEVGSLQG